MWEEYLVSEFDDVILMIFEDSWTKKNDVEHIKKSIQQWTQKFFAAVPKHRTGAEPDVWTKHLKMTGKQ